jgi:large subunit ribosomal protein L10
MKTHEQAMKRKTEQVQQLREAFQRARIAILTDARGDGSGLTVKEITELRRRLREQGAAYQVAKNTLVRRAAHEVGIQGLDPYLEGPTAIAFGFDDPAAAAKTLLEFAREQKPKGLPRLKGAYLEGSVLAPEQVQAIAELPSLPQLQQQILGLMLAPHRQLLAMLCAPGRGLATVLDAWRKKQEGAA